MLTSCFPCVGLFTQLSYFYTQNSDTSYLQADKNRRRSQTAAAAGPLAARMETRRWVLYQPDIKIVRVGQAGSWNRWCGRPNTVRSSSVAWGKIGQTTKQGTKPLSLEMNNFGRIRMLHQINLASTCRAVVNWNLLFTQRHTGYELPFWQKHSRSKFLVSVASVVFLCNKGSGRNGC